ncbi:MAG TPA: hypothetical protein VGC37_13280 [Friedmanniella sp.]
MAAGTIEQVARTVRGHVPDEVGQIGSALAGSASAAAGTSLATAWADAYLRWSTGADAHAQSMRAAADAWTTTDEAVTSRFADRLGPRAV